MSSENKYFSPQKALEYARMSWPQYPENQISEPFYASLAKDIGRLTKRIRSPNPLCLEFGFGAGRILFEISKSFPAAQIIGVEISPAMVEVSRSLLKGMAINFIEGSIEKAPIQDNTADLTVCINVLDRVKDTTVAAQELMRVTKKGGFILVVSAFDYELPFTPTEERLTPPEMIDLFEKNRCQIIEDNHSELVKMLPSGGVKSYKERLLVLWREN